MIARLVTLWKLRPWLTSAFLIACALALFFAGRALLHGTEWARDGHEPVRPWMTVGYIARSWDVDPRALDALADLPLPEVKGHPQPLSEIAADRGVPVETIIAKVEHAIKELRKADPDRDADGKDPGA